MKTCYTILVAPSKIAIADLVPPGELTRSWTITRIDVPEKFRGKGHGSTLLWSIGRDADRELRSLQLEPSPSDGLDYDALVRWYQRYGFRPTVSGYMKRMPLAFPLPPQPKSGA
jgi:predicted GNAT family N-acyltransferase